MDHELVELHFNPNKIVIPIIASIERLFFSKMYSCISQLTNSDAATASWLYMSTKMTLASGCEVQSIELVKFRG